MQTLVLLASLIVLGCASHCDPSPKPCTKEYKPVCARFTKTFANQCQLESSLCQLAKRGFEYDDSPGQPKQGDCCRRPCPYILDPVCGDNGQIYPNECSLKVARCNDMDWIEIVDMCECKNSTHPQHKH